MNNQLDTAQLDQPALFPSRNPRRILEPETTSRRPRSLPSGSQFRPYNPVCYVQPYALKLHRTHRYHFDLRLCYHWIAFSWKIYSLPSHCPDKSSVAIQVEDHGRDSLLFEGVHAEGSRGAGPTIVVDKGVWQPLSDSLDIEESLREGFMRFAFQGSTLLRGVWSLRRQRECYGRDNPRWVMTKEEDEFAVDRDPAEKLDWQRLRSCFTGSRLEEMESNWHLGIQRFRHGASLPFQKSVE